MGSAFEIPPDFRHELRYVDCEDLRSDEEILQSLSNYAPITSEKNIWTFWHAGVSQMPRWCQQNVIGWVRLCRGWNIRVLDDVPQSPNNALVWATANMLPRSYTEKEMNGPWTGQHSADFLRGPCLYLYGGIWLDAGSILLRHVDKICWDQLEDPACSFTVAAAWIFDHWIKNSFVASRKGDPFIKHWHEIFMALWEGRSNCDGIASHPLIAEVFANTKFGQTRTKLEYQVPPTTVLSYVGQVAAWARVCMIEEPNGGFNGREYYATHVMLFDALLEGWPEQLDPEIHPQKLLNILETKLDADPTSPEYKLAYAHVWRLLTKCSLQFISRGKEITKLPQLGLLLDWRDSENYHTDSGTFLELLRYGGVHFEQLREDIVLHKVVKPDVAIRKGILEP